jgi:hypothetical protein
MTRGQSLGVPTLRRRVCQSHRQRRGQGQFSEARVSSVIRRILDNENDLVRLLANELDTDLRAIRKEGNCG